jgi:hypothetical protein
MFFSHSKLPGAATLLASMILLLLVSFVSITWAAWDPEGVPVCTAAGYQGSLVAKPDGFGGMLLAWVDYRDLQHRIFAQRIDAAGNPIWTTNGVLLSADQSTHPGICRDGTGGAYIVWSNDSDGYGDIIVQHLNASGTKLWASAGIVIAAGIGWTDNSIPACTEDGFGGVIVAWKQDIAPPTEDNQVVAQRMGTAGDLRWAAQGVVVGDDIGADQPLDMVTDRPSYGALLGWVNSSGVGIVQRVDLSGAPRMSGAAGHSLGLVTANSRVRVCDRDRVTQGLYAMNMWTGGMFTEDYLEVTALDSIGYQFWSTVVYGGGYTSPKPGKDFRVVDNGLMGVWAVWDRTGDAGEGLGVYAHMLEYDGQKSFDSPIQVSDGDSGDHLPDATLSYYLCVTWVDDSETPARLKYTRVDPGMGYAWAEKTVPGGYSGLPPRIVVGDSGHTPDFPNPLIAWQDQRLGLDMDDIDIYAAGLKANGDPVQPNLVVTELNPAVEPGRAGSGWNSFFVKVKNTGSCPADSFWTTIFPNQVTAPVVGDEPPATVQSVHCGPLAAADSVTVEILVQAPVSAATWSMWAFADYRGDVEEFDLEDDNVFGPRSYEWRALANLAITNVTLSDTDPYPLQWVNATVTVKNTGAGAASVVWIDYFGDRATAPPFGTTGDQRQVYFTIAAGDSVVWTTDPVTFSEFGRTSSWFLVDTYDGVEEENESDNLSGPHYTDWRIPPEDGWPRAGGANFRSSPAIANLDSDPTTLEVVIGCDDGKVYAWGPEGAAVPGWPVTLPDSVKSSPAVADIAGDYHSEVVVGCKDGKLYAYDYLGAKLWEYAAAGPVNTTPALADLDGDDKCEIVFGAGGSLYCLEGNGTAYPGAWPYSAGLGGTFTSPAIGNVDGAGAPEIAVIAYGYTKPAHSNVYLLKPNGSLYSASWPATVDTVVVADPVLGDVASPATDLEIVSGGLDGKVYVWNTNAELWPSPPRVAGSIVASPALHNLDKADAQLEIVVTSREYVSPLPPRWYAWASAIDNDGGVMWSRNAGSWILTTAPAPSAVIAGKGVGDIMAGSPGSDVHSYDRLGAELYGFPLDAGKAVFTSAAVGNIDDDMWLELVVAAGDSVRCWELCSSEYVLDDLWWPMFRHDRARTACYGSEAPTGVDEDAGASAPTASAIRSIFPNPFNPATRIAFEIGGNAAVELAIYDASGRRVATLVHTDLEPGRYEATWNGRTAGGREATSGVYFCRLEAGGAVETKKMVLVR